MSNENIRDELMTIFFAGCPLRWVLSRHGGDETGALSAVTGSLVHALVQARGVRVLRVGPDQSSVLLDPTPTGDWDPDAVSAPAHRAILDAVREVGLRPDLSLAGWHALLSDAVSLSVRGLLAELAVAPLPVVHDPSTGMPPPAYTQSLVARVRERQSNVGVEHALVGVAVKARIARVPGGMRLLKRRQETTDEMVDYDPVMGR